MDLASPVVNSIVTILDRLQTLVNNWCQASDAYADLPVKVGALRTTYNDLKKGVDENGLSSNEAFVKILTEVETRILKEETKLQKRIPKEGTGQIGVNRIKKAWGLEGLWSKLKMTLLPGQVDRSINRIKKAIDDIPKNIHDKRVIRAALRECALASNPTLRFQRDKRYVRLQATEELVRTALTKRGDPKVVLLYGGTGKGKSCLAQDIALQIEPSGEADSSQQSNHGTVPNQLAKTFDRVVYIDCGPKAQIATMQLDLLRKLERGAPESDDKTAQEDTIQGILQSLLQNQKILIIFDDVWSPNIVQSIIGLGGKNVKCLLTSLKGEDDICRPLNCKSECILIENINLTYARQILASHILGHKDGKSVEIYNIPENLEDFANKIIKQVDSNPLALACVATGIHRQKFQDVRTWRKMVEDFSQSLGSVKTAMIHNFNYPCSFWVAIYQSFDRLTKDEKKLFILISLCKGPYVPEEVVECLYKLLKVEGFSEPFSEAPFLKAKTELENRGLIQTRENSCSIHSLFLQFINGIPGTHKSGLESQLKELSKSDGKKGIKKSYRGVDPDILKALINLYFSRETTSTSDGITDTSSFLDKRGYVLEPITRLILANISDLRSHLKKLFLRYVESGLLDEKAAIVLQQSSNSECIAAITDMRKRFDQAAKTNVSMGDEGVSGQS